MKSCGSRVGCWTAEIQVMLIMVTESSFLFKLQEKINHWGLCTLSKSTLSREEVIFTTWQPSWSAPSSSYRAPWCSGYQHNENQHKLVKGDFTPARWQHMFKCRILAFLEQFNVRLYAIFFIIIYVFKQEPWGSTPTKLSKRCCQYGLTKTRGFLGPASRRQTVVHYLDLLLFLLLWDAIPGTILNNETYLDLCSLFPAGRSLL